MEKICKDCPTLPECQGSNIEDCQRREPKPDQGRLLTDEEIDNIRENVALSFIGAKAERAKEGDFETEVRNSIRYSEDAKTASLVMAECEADAIRDKLKEERKMHEELQKELEARGTAEVSESGAVMQVTQCFNESKGEVEYLIFGERRKQAIIPIDEACTKCTKWMGMKFKSVRECQKFQKKDAEIRGFTQLFCPNQFVD